jgi:hypothetical protein
MNDRLEFVIKKGLVCQFRLKVFKGDFFKKWVMQVGDRK